MASADDIIDLVKIQLSTSSELITDDGYESAVATAVAELGWSLPNSDTVQSMWISKRSLRHCIFILWVASAQKFKYKQVNLQQRFEHYDRLLSVMDKEYTDAAEGDASLFSDVESYKQFGTAVGPGFSYDAIGRDTTYDVSSFLNTGD